MRLDFICSSPSRTAIVALAALLAVPAMAQGEAVGDALGVPGPIAFMGEDYALAWTANPSDGYFKQEYVPAGQDVETFTKMVLVEAVVAPISPMEAAVSQIQTLEARREFDPVVNHELIQNEATGEVLLDFVISDLSADPIIVEWNAYRYLPLEGDDGVALFAISHRGYGDDGASELLSGLGETRSKAIDALATYDLPVIAVPQ